MQDDPREPGGTVDEDPGDSRQHVTATAEAEKPERIVRLNEIQREHSLKRNRAHIGEVHEVLIDEENTKKSDEHFKGRNDGNKIVIFSKGNYRQGQFVDVKISDATPNVLRGEVERVLEK